MTIDSALPSVPVETEPPVASSPSDSPASAVRVHYLDNLRAIAMLLGVLLHAGLAYAEPAQSVWFATDTGSSAAVDFAIWFIHLFRMSLFFLLAGYFAKMVVERKGWSRFLWQRCIRIGLPFILFYVPLLIATIGVIVFALSYLDDPKGLIGLIAAASRSQEPREESNSLTLMHLWFLYYLGFFTLASPFAVRLRFLKWDWLFASNWSLIAAPLVLFPAVIAAGVPLPAPESFQPDWWPFLFYGAFYFLGWQLFSREWWLDRLQPKLWLLLAASIVLYCVYYALMPELKLDNLLELKRPPLTAKHLAGCMLTAYLTLWLTLSALLLGRRYLESEVTWVRWLADASYWIYLIHLPIVLFLQNLLVPLPWPVAVKLFACLIGTMLPSLISYVIFVRYTPIGGMLHGKRPLPWRKTLPVSS